MASWETSATSSSFDAGLAFNETAGGRNRDYNYNNEVPMWHGADPTGGVGILSTGGYGENTYKDGNLGETFLAGLSGGYLDYRDTVTEGYDLVGINGNEIVKMREAIRAYVQGIQDCVSDTLTPSADEAAKAFRGTDAVTAVNAYIDKVKLYCQNVTSTLLAFSDKLADVGNAWKTAQQNIGANVNASSGAFSEGTAYRDEKTYTVG